MAFQTGLSGLNVAAADLDVIGNNVANASTVGFKSSRAEFSDVYAASLSGGGSSQIGLGARVAAVGQQFTQGNLTATNSPLDLAINGKGFFRVSDDGAIAYTRNGQFHLDADGYVVGSVTGTVMLLNLQRTSPPSCPTPLPPGIVGSYFALNLALSDATISGAYDYQTCGAPVRGTLTLTKQ